ncbi:MAG: methyltransferase domain-containing protein [Puia sp.]|nr:methyltransferase domain-containing protein [Puia sp.]
MHLNSELLFKRYGALHFKDNIKVLEIGPAGLPSAFQKVINNPTIVWHTIDFADTTFINSSVNNLTYRLTSPYSFPIDADSYDIVLSGQVIEHVEKIWVWLEELKRVTKKNGLIITINPVSWPYHEAPIDCWRIFPSGMDALANHLNVKKEFSLFESLEIEQLLRKDPLCKTIPGRSYNYEVSDDKINSIVRWNKTIRRIPYLRRFEIPIEVSYDMISILRKEIN